MAKKKKILIAVGGTCGHIHPALRLEEELKVEVIYCGTHLKKNPHFPKEKKHYSIHSAHKIRSFFKLGIGFFQSLYLLLKIRPTHIFGFGSYHTLPILFAGILFRKKMALVESNLIPGKVNKFFARFAQKTATFFDESHAHLKQKCITIEPLVHKNYFEKVPRQQCIKHFGLNTKKKTVLIFGGSIGAKVFNEQLPEKIANVLDLEKWQVLHFCGAHSDPIVVQDQYNKKALFARVKPFEKKMHLAFSIADIVISRSGAMTLCELLFFEKPALLIPYPFAKEKHQHHNALFFSDKVKGGLFLDQKHLHLFEQEFKLLLSNPVAYKRNICEYKKQKKTQKLQTFLDEFFEG
jgi:UDP-N-acetylglucosamine--N-acetylmuramyl-(pentapeptide) pyrophosphoryl-undecaprenol N-acetylglucosamine transferase